MTVVKIPEVRIGGSWRRSTTAPLAIPNPFYPPMLVAGAKIVMVGP